MTIVGAFLVKEIRTGGHVRYLELMEGLARRGNRVLVLMNALLPYAPAAFEPIRSEVRYRRGGFPPASWLFAAEAGRRTGEVMRKVGRPDAALVFGETHLAAGSRLARGLGAPLVYGHRSNVVRESLMYLEEPGHGFLERARTKASLWKSRMDEGRIARLADLAVFQSEYDKADFAGRNHHAAGRAMVIRGDISGLRFKPEYDSANRSEGLSRVCFMGTLGRRKGADYFIEAIAELAKRGYRSLRFRVCGPGEGRERLEAKLASAAAQSMAEFPGRVADPFREMASADLVVVPSLFDSYPNTVLEALHVGTPVIGSRVGGIPDMLGRDELLFPPMDSMAIADRIERCIVDPGFYSRVRELCAERRHYFHFDWAEAWEKAILDAFNPRPAAPGE
jgi:glycosyltransferase involved in cell wall biosynthesis